MSLNNIIDADLAKVLSKLTVENLNAVMTAAAQGYNAKALKGGVDAIARGESVDLPSRDGGPKPTQVQAWSFLKDRGQYGLTYGMTSAAAGELMDLLLKDPDKGVEKVRTFIQEHPRTKRSGKAVIVSKVGIPSSGDTEGATPPTGKGGLAALKAEIRSKSGLYGGYRFEAEATDRIGHLAYRVRLGSSLFACFQNKEGAVAVARIVRVKGIKDALVKDNVVFWREGKVPVGLDDFPEGLTFDGVLPQNGAIPPDVASSPKTVVS